MSLLLFLLVLSGCVTKSKAKAQAHAAYVAGQQEALMRMQLAGTQQDFPPGAPPQIQRTQAVTVNGPFRNHTIPWVTGLTLMKAIIAAEYTGQTDPGTIYVVRGGQATVVDPKLLLAGRDSPLQPGDIIQVEVGPAAPENKQQ